MKGKKKHIFYVYLVFLRVNYGCRISNAIAIGKYS